jgi:hypothetical protein
MISPNLPRRRDLLDSIFNDKEKYTNLYMQCASFLHTTNFLGGILYELHVKIGESLDQDKLKDFPEEESKVVFYLKRSVYHRYYQIVNRGILPGKCIESDFLEDQVIDIDVKKDSLLNHDQIVEIDRLIRYIEVNKKLSKRQLTIIKTIREVGLNYKLLSVILNSDSYSLASQVYRIREKLRDDLMIKDLIERFYQDLTR